MPRQWAVEAVFGAARQPQCSAARGNGAPGSGWRPARPSIQFFALWRAAMKEEKAMGKRRLPSPVVCHPWDAWWCLALRAATPLFSTPTFSAFSRPESLSAASAASCCLSASESWTVCVRSDASDRPSAARCGRRPCSTSPCTSPSSRTSPPAPSLVPPSSCRSSRRAARPRRTRAKARAFPPILGMRAKKKFERRRPGDPQRHRQARPTGRNRPSRPTWSPTPAKIYQIPVCSEDANKTIKKKLPAWPRAARQHRIPGIVATVQELWRCWRSSRDFRQLRDYPTSSSGAAVAQRRA